MNNIGWNIQLPKGIQIKPITQNTTQKPQPKNTASNHLSKINEIRSKLKEINKLPQNNKETSNNDDVRTIVKKLTKPGLTIQIIQDENAKKELITKAPKENTIAQSYNKYKKDNSNLRANKKATMDLKNEPKTSVNEVKDWEPCTIMDALEFLEEDHDQGSGSADYEVERLESDSELSEMESKNKMQMRKSINEDFIKIRNTYFMCVLCLEKFGSMKELTTHMNEPVPCVKLIFPYCEVCEKQFTCKSKLANHMATHKEKPQFYCHKCGESFKHSHKLANHLETMHTDYFDALGSIFQCKLCDHAAKTRELILQHINLTHLHISTLLCHICGKSFMNEVRLKVHIMTHREIKSFLCQPCSKAFKTPNSLQAHIKTHNQTKSFICETCGKTFKTSSALKEHKKIHVENTYFCIICDRNFVSKLELEEHIKIHL